MSVTTTADEKLREVDEKLRTIRRVVRENLKDIRLLTIEAFDPETWGSGDLRDDIEGEYHKTANELQELLTKLDKI